MRPDTGLLLPLGTLQTDQSAQDGRQEYANEKF